MLILAKVRCEDVILPDAAPECLDHVGGEPLSEPRAVDRSSVRRHDGVADVDGPDPTVDTACGLFIPSVLVRAVAQLRIVRDLVGEVEDAAVPLRMQAHAPALSLRAGQRDERGLHLRDGGVEGAMHVDVAERRREGCARHALHEVMRDGCDEGRGVEARADGAHADAAAEQLDPVAPPLDELQLGTRAIVRFVRPFVRPVEQAKGVRWWRRRRWRCRRRR